MVFAPGLIDPKLASAVRRQGLGQGLMSIGGGLMAAGAGGGPQAISQGFQGAAQAMDPMNVYRAQMMQGQLREAKDKAAQREAWQKYVGGMGGGAPGAQPALGGYLTDMPGGGTMPAGGAPGAGGALTDPAASASASLLSGYPRELLAALSPEQGMSLLMQQMKPQNQKPTTLMQNLEAAGFAPGTPEYQARAAAAIPGAAGGGREKAQDAEGYWRFVDSGERVFPDVQKPAEQPDPSQVGGMRKEFSNQSRDYKLVRDAFRKIENAATGEPSAGGDMSLIFSYMKMLDPGSTVREGEFATAQNTAGVPTQVRNFYNRARTGEMLAPEQRADFLNQSRKIYDSQAETQTLLEEQYRGLAERSGYDPDNIVIDYQGNLRGSGAESPTAGLPDTSEKLQQLSDEELLKRLGIE